MKIRISRRMGFTLVEIMIVVAIIGLLATVAVPNVVKARTTAQSKACITNLKQIEGAVQQWAFETKQGESASPAYEDIKPYLKGSITCPAGGKSFADSYRLGTVDEQPSCLKVPATHKLPNDG